MFGGTPICPRCTKAVYAAEQVMGPGRKAYHRPCLACTSCNKRLDSYTLLEHDEQPYCKACHLKSFGTPNLRHNNLPVASPPGSNDNSPQRPTSPPTYIRPVNTGTGSYSSYGNGSPAPISSQVPRLQPNRTLTSPTSPTFSRSPISPNFTGYGYRNGMNGVGPATPSAIPEDESNFVEDVPQAIRNDSGRDTNTGRPGIGTIPRTVPLRHYTSRSTGSVPLSVSNSTTTTSYASDNPDVFTSAAPSSYTPLPPLMATPTGTRYGIALSGGVTSHSTGGIGTHLTGSSTGGSPRKWGSGTPSCPRCGKSVFFAEQAKAVGKTYHKACLRCVDCGTTLDSHKLRDHDGQPYCVRCYQKQYGPQGNGYALLGKAGG